MVENEDKNKKEDLNKNTEKINLIKKLELFEFGETNEKYDVKVLNEREVRAGSGILFLFAFFSFFNALYLRNFFYLKIFITSFFVDFFIRLFINPKYSPVLILGRLIVKNQKPEYSGAKQKKFAWTIGFILSITMFILVVLLNKITPINLYICIACLTFLFFETAFGICLGCYVYKFICKENLKLCPGGICEIHREEKIQKVNLLQIIVLVLFIIFIVFLTQSIIK